MAHPLKPFSFPKKLRLCATTEIETLYKKGNTFLRHPFKVTILRELEAQEGVIVLPRVIFVVPKRSFKRAVVRNLLRRRMREAYRLNKGHFLDPATYQPALPQIKYLSFYYVAKDILPYQAIEKKIISILLILVSGSELEYIKPRK